MNATIMKNRIFISYAKEDHDIAERLYNDLKADQLMPWIDIYELLPGQNWEIEIESVISQCSYFMLLLSKNSVTKEGHIQKEIRLALDRALKIPDGRIFIIPIRIEECEPHFKELKKFHYVDLFADYSHCLGMLKRVFGYAEKEKLVSTYREQYPRTGYVCSKRAEGYGFITELPNTKKDVFFHQQELQDITFNDLNEGDTVSYFLAEGPKGIVATNVSRH